MTFSFYPITFLTILLASFLSSFGALAAEPVNPVDMGEYLRRFHADPKTTMNTPLAKYDEAGRLISDDLSPFADEGLTREEIFQVRKNTRLEICRRSGRTDCDREPRKRGSTWSAPSAKNVFTRFLFEETFLKSPRAMEEAKLLEAAVAEKPWSDSFWPMQKGMAARRWADDTFPDTRDWMENYAHFLMFPPGFNGVVAMSPAEKYDLLVGDGTFALTQNMWSAGKRYADNGQKVPGWTGLCHGWAPASIMAPNPQKSVTVNGANGNSILFYPSDIKALASLGWGEARVAGETKMAGERCYVSNPKEDAVGRVIDEDCWDVNPATWHVGVVNQIGVNKRSFIFDTQYDTQVWNFPVYGYRYQYFNPQTLAQSKTLAGSVVRLDQFTIDKFKTYRSPNAKFVVGIAMEVTYVSVTGSSRRAQNTPKLVTHKYVYDLELDAFGDIIGGEWYSNFHPDFLWNLRPDSRPRSDGEAGWPAPIAWDGQSPVPQEFTDAARISSPKSQPVWPVVETLLNLSKDPGGPE